MYPLEELHFIKGLDPVADALSGTVRSDVVNMKHFDKLLFVIHKGVGATGRSVVTVEASDDVVPTNTTAVPFRYREMTSGDTQGAIQNATAAGFTLTAGSSQICAVELDCAELGDTGYNYASLKAAESVDSPVLAGILIFGIGKRYNTVSTALT